MALKKITQIKGKAVHVPGDDIDTDRIIPAMYMKCVTFDGLGEFLFKDVRFDKNGKPKPHPLNDSKRKGAAILISGNNFGCGSSREHAPQAIYRAGFQAIIAGNFAEIFFGNATTLGIACVNLSKENLNELAILVEKSPSTEVTIDLVQKKISTGEKSWNLEIRESARRGLINGHWDAIAELLEGVPQVKKLVEKLKSET